MTEIVIDPCFKMLCDLADIFGAKGVRKIVIEVKIEEPVKVYIVGLVSPEQMAKVKDWAKLIACGNVSVSDDCSVKHFVGNPGPSPADDCSGGGGAGTVRRYPRIDYDPEEAPVAGMVRWCNAGYGGPGNYIYSPVFGWQKMEE